MSTFEEIYYAKYMLQTVLKKFLIKDLRPGKFDMYQINCDIFDDKFDVICFYVPKSDVIMINDKYCEVLLTQKEYEVFYYQKDDSVDVVRENINRCIIADAYYKAHPDKYQFRFDLMCVSSGAILESNDSFSITFMSTKIAPNSFVTFSVSKQSVHWIYDKEHVLDNQYAHIDLNYQIYSVAYKSKETRWKEVSIDVTKDDIIHDFLNSKRAMFFDVLPKKYIEYLQQEYEFSCLFQEIDV